MLSDSGPLVSVVTPVYNGERYLAECIESVLSQTYPHWEYVVVNNRSTDDSRQIAQQYADQDARIRIHDNEAFLSQMQNWNHALRQISPNSRYCKVLHADDWLFPQCLARMVTLAEKHPSVGVVSAYRLDETRVNLDGLPYSCDFLPGRTICRSVLLGDLSIFGSPTSLLIRSDLIRKRPRFYDESTVGADTQACFDLLQESDFGFVHQVLTYTRRHNESMTSLTHRFDIRRVGRLVALTKYGPVYLEEEEYRRRLGHALTSYHAFLARSVLELQGKDFWGYHQAELKKLGYSIRPAMLIRALLGELSDLRQSVRRLRSVLRSRKEPTAEWEAVLGSIYGKAHKDEDER